MLNLHYIALPAVPIWPLPGLPETAMQHTAQKGKFRLLESLRAVRSVYIVRPRWQPSSVSASARHHPLLAAQCSVDLLEQLNTINNREPAIGVEDLMADRDYHDETAHRDDTRQD